ncbi:NfeD family protein [Paenarthrobacter nicotinovorans]|uniref:NfeD family protein n=1 Tax=Paenarthrobacter nicotinovorans TaxID=29320 RepID=UPI0016680A7B|nr:NfeD family protein [Paenarthrobacter nicotinovorans]MBP2396519.1 membrane protein implicated in regulation of membrane protease activity [Paenarthrobacter nicotinovorans]UKE97418.1 NfeD family protein [Paenarthrobacter nicotinovorans]UKF02204.1 NfeD family protein [Paenarthrobacter nicotinovorans]GGV26593.1 membrane protein [Paenarthrobacter nicotinovorans]
MFEWLGENWWALWLTVFLAFAVVEMLTLDLFFIMLGGGALAGLIADFAGADFWLQIVIFCVISLLMIVFVRPVALNHLRKGPTEQLSNIDRLIGQPALVIEAVSSTSGLVKIGGDVWSARSAAGVIDAGATVQVTKIDGATAVVASAADNSSR